MPNAFVALALRLEKIDENGWQNGDENGERIASVNEIYDADGQDHSFGVR